MLSYFHAWNCVFEGMPRPFWTLLKYFSDLEYAWEKASLKELEVKGLKGPYLENFKKFKKTGEPFNHIDEYQSAGIKMACFRDKSYPKQLRNLNNHLPPAIIYIKGSIPEETTYLSIVGTRDMTEYGQQITTTLLKKLAGYKLCIVSGLARGIDTLAHQNAIKNNLKTIAVLGYGHENTPFYIKYLCDQIIERGAIISEYPPYLKAQKYYFPLRNRIISGLSKATLVVEAGKKSGALITANYALDQGREVMAIPGNLYQEKSFGTNGLIGSSSAHLVQDENDILSILKLEKQDRQLIHIDSIIQKNILKALSTSPLSRSDLIKKTNIKVNEINAALTELEIQQYVTKNKFGKYYITY